VARLGDERAEAIAAEEGRHLALGDLPLRNREREGLAAHDARVKEVVATPAGRKAFALAIPRWQVAQREMSAFLGGDRFRALVTETRHLARRSKKRATA
jgi:hypothetical protein